MESLFKIKSLPTGGKFEFALTGNYKGYAFTVYLSSIYTNKIVIVDNDTFKHVLTIGKIIKTKTIKDVELLEQIHIIINGLPILNNRPDFITSTAPDARSLAGKK